MAQHAEAPTAWQVYRGLRSGVQDVAIKVLSYSEELQMQQFWVEINLLKSLSFDRNVVQFYGVVLDEACPMLVSQLHGAVYRV